MKVKTTTIEKKYRDKKTGEYKSLTINHAKVKDRLMAFWESSPRGSIETSSSFNGDILIFKTKMIADQSEPYSRNATGHAMGRVLDKDGNIIEKEMEKLETISVGRCLALLGYASSGEVASYEEMEEFMKYQENKKIEARIVAIEKLDSCKSLSELQEMWGKLGTIIQDSEVINRKNELKEELA